MARTEKVHHCLDLFGATQKVSSTWRNAGFSATAYDIQISSGHDITSEAGFKRLLQLSAQSFRCGLTIARFRSFSFFFILLHIFSTIFNIFSCLEMVSFHFFSILSDCSPLMGRFFFAVIVKCQ